MSALNRPERPYNRPRSALAAPSIPVDAAALITRQPEEVLFGAAEGGWLPPWIAAKPAFMPLSRPVNAKWQWRFSAALNPGEMQRHLEDGWLWLERLHVHDSDLTAAWAADPDIGTVDITQIAEWCRCARPDGLTAEAGLFAMWCADHQRGATMTAHRHDTLSRWFEMLRAEGVLDVADTHPADLTRVGVITYG